MFEDMGITLGEFQHIGADHPLFFIHHAWREIQFPEGGASDHVGHHVLAEFLGIHGDAGRRAIDRFMVVYVFQRELQFGVTRIAEVDVVSAADHLLRI